MNLVLRLLIILLKNQASWKFRGHTSISSKVSWSVISKHLSVQFTFDRSSFIGASIIRPHCAVRVSVFCVSIFTWLFVSSRKCFKPFLLYPWALHVRCLDEDSGQYFFANPSIRLNSYMEEILNCWKYKFLRKSSYPNTYLYMSKFRRITLFLCN